MNKEIDNIMHGLWRTDKCKPQNMETNVHDMFTTSKVLV